LVEVQAGYGGQRGGDFNARTPGAAQGAFLFLAGLEQLRELLANCFAASDAALGGNPESITLDNIEETSALEVFVVVDSYIEEPEPFTLELTLR